MHPDRPHVPRLSSRRDFLCKAGGGFGALALSYLLARDGFAAPGEPLVARPAQFPSKARSVIFLFMEGGPSHLDTFDPKPALDKIHMTAFQRQDRFASAMASVASWSG